MTARIVVVPGPGLDGGAVHPLGPRPGVEVEVRPGDPAAVLGALAAGHPSVAAARCKRLGHRARRCGVIAPGPGGLDAGGLAGAVAATPACRWWRSSPGTSARQASAAGIDPPGRGGGAAALRPGPGHRPARHPATSPVARAGSPTPSPTATSRARKATCGFRTGDGPHPVAVLFHGGFWYHAWERDLMDGLAHDLARPGHRRLERRVPQSRRRRRLAGHRRGRRPGRRPSRRSCPRLPPRPRPGRRAGPFGRRASWLCGRRPGAGGPRCIPSWPSVWPRSPIWPPPAPTGSAAVLSAGSSTTGPSMTPRGPGRRVAEGTLPDRRSPGPGPRRRRRGGARLPDHPVCRGGQGGGGRGVRAQAGYRGPLRPDRSRYAGLVGGGGGHGESALKRWGRAARQAQARTNASGSPHQPASVSRPWSSITFSACHRSTMGSKTFVSCSWSPPSASAT